MKIFYDEKHGIFDITTPKMSYSIMSGKDDKETCGVQFDKEIPKEIRLEIDVQIGMVYQCIKKLDTFLKEI